MRERGPEAVDNSRMVIRFAGPSLILVLTLPPDKVQGWRIIGIGGAGGDLRVECKHVWKEYYQ